MKKFKGYRNTAKHGRATAGTPGSPIPDSCFLILTGILLDASSLEDFDCRNAVLLLCACRFFHDYVRLSLQGNFPCPLPVFSRIVNFLIIDLKDLCGYQENLSFALCTDTIFQVCLFTLFTMGYLKIHISF